MPETGSSSDPNPHRRIANHGAKLGVAKIRKAEHKSRLGGHTEIDIRRNTIIGGRVSDGKRGEQLERQEVFVELVNRAKLTY